MAELEGDDLAALQSAFASAQGRATAADMATPTALAKVQSMIYQVADT